MGASACACTLSQSWAFRRPTIEIPARAPRLSDVGTETGGVRRESAAFCRVDDLERVFERVS